MSVDGKSGPKVWMDWWTVFYWGWWVSWSPFVGIFIAKISKGRTVGELINASLTGFCVSSFSLYRFHWLYLLISRALTCNTIPLSLTVSAAPGRSSALHLPLVCHLWRGWAAHGALGGARWLSGTVPVCRQRVIPHEVPQHVTLTRDAMFLCYDALSSYT